MDQCEHCIMACFKITQNTKWQKYAHTFKLLTYIVHFVCTISLSTSNFLRNRCAFYKCMSNRHFLYYIYACCIIANSPYLAGSPNIYAIFVLLHCPPSTITIYILFVICLTTRSSWLRVLVLVPFSYRAIESWAMNDACNMHTLIWLIVKYSNLKWPNVRTQPIHQAHFVIQYSCTKHVTYQRCTIFSARYYYYYYRDDFRQRTTQ